MTSLENSNVKPTIFLDIDGVLTTTYQYYTLEKNWPEYGRYRFDDKCVKVYNQILEKTDAITVLSSDWNLDYSIQALNNIFKINKVNCEIFDITQSLWGTKYKSLNDLDVCRAEEILMYVKEHDLTKWVAIDDLNLTPWIPDNFVRCPRANEGIKQSSIKDKILSLLL